MVDIASNKITDFVKFDAGALCMVTGGRNAGFILLYLWAILTLMSTIGGRNELHYVSKLLLCAFDHEYVL
jgi:hypothetical protein